MRIILSSAKEKIGQPPQFEIPEGNGYVKGGTVPKNLVVCGIEDGLGVVCTASWTAKGGAIPVKRHARYAVVLLKNGNVCRQVDLRTLRRVCHGQTLIVNYISIPLKTIENELS